MTTTSIMPEPRQRYFNNNGTVAAGCYLYTYAAGTSTPKATYTDSAGTTPHANPIVLDSKGEALIYWDGSYKVDLKTAAGVQITGYPVDNYVSTDTLISASDAILRADLAAPSGASLMGANDYQTQDEANLDRVSIKRHGAAGDGVTDDTAAIQGYINLCEQQGYGYLYVPTWTEDYKVSAPLRFEVGDFRIFGDKGAQLVHPFSDGTARTFRKGNLVATAAATAVIDLGGYKTRAGYDPSPYAVNNARNAAATYTVENISMRASVAATTNGIECTGMQNGPDRAIYILGCSGYLMKNGVYVPPAPTVGVSIMVANLTVERSSFNFGGKAVLVDGPVYGAYFANNNFEGNASGAIHGNINGVATIINNMLENVPNPVNLEPLTRLALFARGNYFEYHPTSDYIYRVKGADSYLEYVIDVDGDFSSGVDMPTYYIELSGKGRWDIQTPYRTLIKSVPALGVFVIKKGSRLFDEQGVLEFDRLLGTIVADVDGWEGRTDIDNAWIHSYPHDSATRFAADTPLGVMDVVDMADDIRVDFGQVIQNKLVVTNFLMRCDPAIAESSPARLLQARTAAGGFVVGPGNILDYINLDICQGEWRLVSIIWKSTSNVQIVDFFVEAALAGMVHCAGVTSTVIGTYVGDGTDGIKSVSPVRVNYKPAYSTVASVAALTLPKGEVITVTGTTTITSIVATNNSGRRVTLIFPSALTLTDGSNLKLNGNYVTTADDTLTLVCDGVSWYEVSRSAN